MEALCSLQTLCPISSNNSRSRQFNIWFHHPDADSTELEVITRHVR